MSSDHEVKSELSSIYKEEKRLKNRKLALLKKISDPNKNPRLFEILKTLYLKILDTEVSEDLNLKSFIQNVIGILNEDDFIFWEAHKYDPFHKGSELLKVYPKHRVQKTLTKEKYLTALEIKRQKSLNHLIKYLAGAKVQQYRDSLIKELKALRLKESLRYSLFEQEGYNQIDDFNERECLLMLKSNPQLTHKVMMEKLKIRKTTWYRYKENFERKGLL